MSELATLFQAHIDERQRSTAQALADTGFEALVISSGKVYTTSPPTRMPPSTPRPTSPTGAPWRAPTTCWCCARVSAPA